jgi:hypothetical protein
MKRAAEFSSAANSASMFCGATSRGGVLTALLVGISAATALLASTHLVLILSQLEHAKQERLTTVGNFQQGVLPILIQEAVHRSGTPLGGWSALRFRTQLEELLEGTGSGFKLAGVRWLEVHEADGQAWPASLKDGVGDVSVRETVELDGWALPVRISGVAEVVLKRSVAAGAREDVTSFHLSIGSLPMARVQAASGISLGHPQDVAQLTSRRVWSTFDGAFQQMFGPEAIHQFVLMTDPARRLGTSTALVGIDYEGVSLDVQGGLLLDASRLAAGDAASFWVVESGGEGRLDIDTGAGGGGGVLLILARGRAGGDPLRIRFSGWHERPILLLADHAVVETDPMRMAGGNLMIYLGPDAEYTGESGLEFLQILKGDGAIVGSRMGHASGLRALESMRGLIPSILWVKCVKMPMVHE